MRKYICLLDLQDKLNGSTDCHENVYSTETKVGSHRRAFVMLFILVIIEV